MRNLPDDWSEYYRKCVYCGRVYHASEGCDCFGDEYSICEDEDDHDRLRDSDENDEYSRIDEDGWYS